MRRWIATAILHKFLKKQEDDLPRWRWGRWTALGQGVRDSPWLLAGEG